MLVHDIIKIKYVKLGYLKKNYPYHLISDEEMFNAFIDLGTEFKSNLIDPRVRFFNKYYPNPFEKTDIYYKLNAAGDVVAEYNLYDMYQKLKGYIVTTINAYMQAHGTLSEFELPDWIYTYMLGEVVYNKSEYLDIQDTLALLGCSNLDNAFTKEACIACFATSLNYVATLSTGSRPATVFGEPHVIKQLRLEA